ncbi:MAG: DUF63 family protein [Candidatus Micrarchaeia archaeon]
MEAGGFIETYFIEPIYDRTGYNLVNTVVYATIALFVAFVFFKILKREKVKIDEKFILRIIPFILLGSTVRVVTDATGESAATNQFLLNSSALFGLYGVVGNSHLYDYSIITTTPGIYVVIGLLTFLSVLLFNRMKKMELLPSFAFLLFLPHFILLIPLMKNWLHALLVILLTILGVIVGKFLLERKLKPNTTHLLVVFSHSLDGAASYVAIELFTGAYFEQHVLSAGLGAIFGTMLAFYVVKVLFSTLAVYILETSDEKREEKDYMFLLLIIFGLAPGVRDTLRLLAGV